MPSGRDMMYLIVKLQYLSVNHFQNILLKSLVKNGKAENVKLGYSCATLV